MRGVVLLSEFWFLRVCRGELSRSTGPQEAAAPQSAVEKLGAASIVSQSQSKPVRRLIRQERLQTRTRRETARESSNEPPPPPFPDGACRGRALCRCDDQSFCNFDGGDSSFWSCEQCSSFESVEKCSTDGLPEAGEKDCKACCFGDSGGYAPTYKPTVEPQPTYRPTTQRR